MRQRILIILPLRGGALTVGVHFADALSTLPGVELSILASGPLHNLYEKAFRHIGDNTERQRAVVEHINLAAMGRVVEFKPDLVLVMALSPVSPWFIENAKQLGVLTAHWYIENFRYAPIDPVIPPWQAVAPIYDYFFTIQRGEFFEALKARGVRRYHYLPTACNPRIHHRVKDKSAVEPRYCSDISFVGSVYPNRITLFKGLSEFPIALWGPGWSEIPDLKACARGNGAWVTSAEEKQIMNGTKIGLNIHSSLAGDAVVQKGDFLNPRVFTIAACGAFQLVDDQDPLPEVFEPGKEVATYTDLPSLHEQLKTCLKDPGGREKIAGRAFQRVMEEHTYAHRIKEMLAVMSLN